MSELAARIGLSEFIQILVQIWNCLYLVIMIFLIFKEIKRSKTHYPMEKISVPFTKELLIFYIVILFYNLFNIICSMCSGNTSPAAYWAKRICEFAYFASGAFLTAFMLEVLKRNTAVKLGNGGLKRIITGFQLLQAVNMALLIINQFAGVLYRFDARNYYYRIYPGYGIWYFTTTLSFVFAVIVVAVYWKRLNSFIRQVVMVSVTVPLIGFMCNYIYSGISYNNISVSITAFIIFILYERRRSAIVAETANEMERLRTRLMLSQIQPHFLHNCLNAIIYYSDKDAAITKKALLDFSKYLRTNLEIDEENDIVSFGRELEHTKLYVSLEKLRFEDKLSVVFDIRDDRFLIPKLTLQPLVENAIRHGIRKSKSGSTVKISSEDGIDCHIITVRDDGAGFDTSILDTLDNTHIGIRNIRNRLRTECGGELMIESVRGKGTICIIKIPKEEKADEDTGDR